MHWGNFFKEFDPRLIEDIKYNQNQDISKLRVWKGWVIHQSPQASISDSMRSLRFLLVQLCPQKQWGRVKTHRGKKSSPYSYGWAQQNLAHSGPSTSKLTKWREWFLTVLSQATSSSPVLSQHFVHKSVILTWASIS